MSNVTLEQINRNVLDLKKEMDEIKEMLKEDFELSDFAVNRLREARKTPESEYVDL